MYGSVETIIRFVSETGNAQANAQTSDALVLVVFALAIFGLIAFAGIVLQKKFQFAKFGFTSYAQTNGIVKKVTIAIAVLFACVAVISGAILLNSKSAIAAMQISVNPTINAVVDKDGNVKIDKANLQSREGIVLDSVSTKLCEGIETLNNVTLKATANDTVIYEGAIPSSYALSSFDLESQNEISFVFSGLTANQISKLIDKDVAVVSFNYSAEEILITGVVKDSITGLPIQGADVIFRNNTKPFETQTDQTGFFSLYIDPNLTGYWFISCYGYEYYLGDAVSYTQDDVINFDIDPCTVLHGSVTDSYGQPVKYISGVYFGFTPDDGSTTIPAEINDGQYSFEISPIGSAGTLWVDAEGYFYFAQHFTAEEMSTESIAFDFKLNNAATIYGQVKDDMGKFGLMNAIVSFLAEDGQTYTAKTDEYGFYTVDVPVNELGVWKITHENYDTYVSEPVSYSKSTSDVNFELHRS